QRRPERGVPELSAGDGVGADAGWVVIRGPGDQTRSELLEKALDGVRFPLTSGLTAVTVPRSGSAVSRRVRIARANVRVSRHFANASFGYFAVPSAVYRQEQIRRVPKRMKGGQLMPSFRWRFELWRPAVFRPGR